MPTMTTIAAIVGATCMTVGIIGTLMPRLPGVYFVFLGAFLSGLLTGFQEISTSFVAACGALVLLVYMLDARGSRGGGKPFHVTFLAIVGATLGGILGSTFGGWTAIVAAAAIGGIIGGLLGGGDTFFALESKTYTFVGYLGGSTLKFITGVLILLAWLRRMFA